MKIKQLLEKLSLYEDSDTDKYNKQLFDALSGITTDTWGLHYKLGEYFPSLVTETEEPLYILNFYFLNNYKSGLCLSCPGQKGNDYLVKNSSIGFDPEQHGFTDENSGDRWTATSYVIKINNEKEVNGLIDKVVNIVKQYLPKIEEQLTKRFEDLSEDYLEPCSSNITDFRSLYLNLQGKKYKCFNFGKIRNILKALTKNYKLSSSPSDGESTIYSYLNRYKTNILFKSKEDAQAYKDSEYDYAYKHREYPSNNPIKEILVRLSAEELNILFTKYPDERIYIVFPEDYKKALPITMSEQTGRYMFSFGSMNGYYVWDGNLVN